MSVRLQSTTGEVQQFPNLKIATAKRELEQEGFDVAVRSVDSTQPSNVFPILLVGAAVFEDAVDVLQQKQMVAQDLGRSL